MAQPILTYTVSWGAGNIYQKLSGKTYVDPNGNTVDCSSLTVTFSSSQHIKKFYATAVKANKAYGFDNDELVDIRTVSPTGVLLYELTNRNADTNFSFTFNTSSLTDGEGQYRIGLYVQNDDNIWNYEYILVTSAHQNLVSSDSYTFMVPVETTN